MTKLSNEQLLNIVSLKDEMSQRNIAKELSIPRSTIGAFLRKETYKEFWERYTKPVTGGTTKKSAARKISGKKGYVFTAAQNNTKVHREFLKSLELYCDRKGYQLIVSTFHYNKNGYQNGFKGKENEVWFDPAIKPYIQDESLRIADDLIFCGELNILPTAVNPMSGFQSYTGLASSIIPHAKLQLESVPTHKNDDPKIMYTTGAVTQMNYISKTAGHKAEWNHVFGALVVEFNDNGDWFARQLVAESDTGNFYDLDEYQTPTGHTTGNTLEAINWGDIHASKLDNVVANASWGDNSASMLNTLKPKYQFVHDVFDFTARNHHNMKDPHFLMKMHSQCTESVRAEIDLTCSVMNWMKRDYSEVVVVESNHDLGLERWLKEQDYRKDPVNAITFLELQTLIYKAISKGEEIQIFKEACKLYAGESIEDGLRFLKTDESFRICDGKIECGDHGHQGNNGARGGIKGFSVRGIKSNTGHTHSAQIWNGNYVSGVSGKLDMGYNKGGSSWNNSHILTYKNGKRAIATLKNGEWRA